MLYIVYPPSPRCRCGQPAWETGECPTCAGKRIGQQLVDDFAKALGLAPRSAVLPPEGK